MHTPDQLLRTLLETIPDRIYFKDRDSRFISVNPAMEKFMGAHTDAEFLGKTDHDIFLAHHADEARADEKRVMETGEPLIAKIEEEIKPDGKTSWVSTTKIPMRNEEGEIIGTCGISRDITAERQLQGLVIQKEKEALLESLVGGIAHELNNKVLPLLGFTELLMDETSETFDQAKIKRYGTIIKRSSLECAAIIRQLLDLRQPSSNKPINCDLATITREAVSFLTFQFRNSKIIAQENYPDESVFVYADPSQITQVVINLCLNAVDAMQDRPLRILTVSVLTKEDQAIIQVEDTGSGITGDVLARIFDPFFTTKKAETARGLGLTVSRSIAHQYHGEIRAKSSPEAGSVFQVQLPLAKVTPPPSEAVRSAVVFQESSLHPSLRVLLVDDEEPIGTLVGEILQRKMHMTVDRAANGQEAIDRLKTTDYDLVISDIRMPVMSGTELLKWLQENRPSQIKRFFFITGDEGTLNNREAIARANIPVLNKPFPINTLISFCNEILTNPKE